MRTLAQWPEVEFHPNALSFAVGLPSVKRALAFVFGKDHIIHFRYLTFPRRS